MQRLNLLQKKYIFSTVLLLIFIITFKQQSFAENTTDTTDTTDKKSTKFEKEIKMENDSYTRWYFLNRNKMIYRKDMSDQNDYASINKSDLANAYLFDELPENDAKIKIAIDAALKEKDINLSDEIMGNLILLKYLIFQRDTDNIEKQTKHLNSLFEIGALESNLKGLEVAFNATKFQIALMK